MREKAGAPAHALFQPALAFLRRARTGLRIAAVLRGLAAGAACAAGVVALAALAGWSPHEARAAGAACGSAMWAVAVAVLWRGCTTARAALEIEREAPHVGNLLVTIEQLIRQPRRVHAVVAGEMARQASIATATIEIRTARFARAPASLAAVVLCGALLFAFSLNRAGASHGVTIQTAAVLPAPNRAWTLSVHVRPPEYTRRAASTLANPAQVHVLEGSAVRLEISGAQHGLELVEPSTSATPLGRQGRIQAIDLEARQTKFYLLREQERPEQGPRALALIVQPDKRPVVRISKPARDLAFSAPQGQISLAIDASDDLGLTDLSVRYTHVAGSGETFSFKEGTLPIRVARPAPDRWSGSGELSLASLGLQTGDTLVYRAVARDAKPGAEPSASEAYLVEIGSVSGISSEGFALPVEKDRHAISQQMIIVKTERLLASQRQLQPGALREQSRLLGVEQRMVRAEFVFMTGGEVEDEEEEAAHSHDLVEGRFENEGTRELLTAVREMSRAEAALNESTLSEALVFERAALQALQRAFDRRRYFLKTVPERARIDASRRLTGERADATGASHPRREPLDSGELGALREISQALAEVAERDRGGLAETAARLGALAPMDPSVQAMALRLAEAEGAAPHERRAVVLEALRLLSARTRAAVGPPATGGLPERDVLGHFADERSPGGGSALRPSSRGSRGK